MYKTKLNIHLTCPKHKRFNGTDYGAVKAGCKVCSCICEVADVIADLRNVITVTERAINEVKLKSAT